MVHKVFYLLQKNIKLNKNIYNISILMNIFMNLYDDSSIDCYKKIIKYMICIIILFLIISFIVINIKIFTYLLFINKAILLLIHVTTVV